MQMPKTIQIKNGEKVTPTFSAQEYANRQGKLRAYMAQKIVNHALADAHYRMVGIQPGQLRCLTPLHRIPEVVLDRQSVMQYVYDM